MITYSVIIPTFNRPVLLERCLASLTNEVKHHTGCEIIVADDGSTPSNAAQNRKLCDQYSAHYLESTINCGMAVARNRGILASSGRWIVFLDDDVTCDNGWFAGLQKVLMQFHDTIIAFEGTVNPSGDGLWDREVQNTKGGAYLTCHFGVRREILATTGGFDEHFSATGPFCEDHEFAARLGRWGTIAFCDTFAVTHAPRLVNPVDCVLHASVRILQLLTSDAYFFSQHPDRYHLFRSHRHFLGTLRSFLFRHILSTLKRRSLHSLFKHPVQTLLLLLVTCIEQLTIWIFLPRLIYSSNRNCSSLLKKKSAFTVPRIRPTIRSFSSILLTGKSGCKVYPSPQSMPWTYSDRLYLRIDDMFLCNHAPVREFCSLLKEYNTPFLAALTGNDLLESRNWDSIYYIMSSGGEIGVHGFTHTGKFGPFNSEILQMTIPDIFSALAPLKQIPPFSEQPPQVFIPPFNAISAQQIIALASVFKIICGGPETARFTDNIAGIVTISDNCRYFPSFPPFYGTAASIIRSKFLDHAYLPDIPVCLTTHFTDEIKDSFNSLRKLLSMIPCRIQQWNRLY